MSGGEPSFETITLERADGVATVSLNRPDKLNALNLQMIRELIAVIDVTDADDDVRAVIFTGNGRAFCAGADLSEGADIFSREGQEFEMPRHADGGGMVTRRFFDSAKPLIAAINGPAVGIGITLTLPMDIRLAAEDSKMGFLFARRGLVPEASSTFFLPRLVGIQRAAEWVYTGRMIPAQEALETGLVRSLHPAGELLPAARELAAEMAGSSAVAVAMARRMMWRMLAGGDPAAAHDLDSEALHFLGPGADVREGVTAFLEKREADFPMRVSTDMPEFYARWREDGRGFDPAFLELGE